MTPVSIENCSIIRIDEADEEFHSFSASSASEDSSSSSTSLLARDAQTSSTPKTTYGATKTTKKSDTDSNSPPHAPMAHHRVYSMAPLFWRWVGKWYPFLDLIGGSLFSLGAVCFLLPSAFDAAKSDVSATAKNYISLAGVILFTIAKAFLESRAVYADLWSRQHLRPSKYFHAGVVSFFFGGVSFIVTVVADLVASSPMSRAETRTLPISGIISSFLFGLGAVLFIVDAVLEHSLKLRKPWHPSNTNPTGALCLLVGAVLYVLTEACQLPEVHCDEQLVVNTGLWGGIFFLVGSLFLLAFGVYELIEARGRGKDPRTVTRDGDKQPHPFRRYEGTQHEHLDAQPHRFFQSTK